MSGKAAFVIVRREPVRKTRRTVGLISFRGVVWCVFVQIGVENRKNASEMKGAPPKRGKHESPDVGREEGVGGLAFSEPFQASGRVVRACGERELFSVTKVELWGEQETQPQPSPTAQTPRWWSAQKRKKKKAGGPLGICIGSQRSQRRRISTCPR